MVNNNIHIHAKKINLFMLLNHFSYILLRLGNVKNKVGCTETVTDRKHFIKRYENNFIIIYCRSKRSFSFGVDLATILFLLF